MAKLAGKSEKEDSQDENLAHLAQEMGKLAAKKRGEPQDRTNRGLEGLEEHTSFSTEKEEPIDSTPDEEQPSVDNDSTSIVPILEDSFENNDAAYVLSDDDLANETVTSGTSYTYTTEEMFQQNIDQIQSLKPSEDIRKTQQTTISPSEMAEIESEIQRDPNDTIEKVEFDHWGPLFEGYYSGQIHCDTKVPHGFGTLTLNSGTTYVGQWKDANRHGYGEFLICCSAIVIMLMFLLIIRT